MRIPVLIESKGPCESAWVPRRGLRRIRIEGLDGYPLKVEDSKLVRFIDTNGEHSLGLNGERIRVRHFSKSSVNVELC